MFFSLWAYASVLGVSSVFIDVGETVAIIDVLCCSPKESWRILLRFFVFPSTRALFHQSKQTTWYFQLHKLFYQLPQTEVFSLPARSTKLVFPVLTSSCPSALVSFIWMVTENRVGSTEICISVNSCNRSFCCASFQDLVGFIFFCVQYFFKAFHIYTCLVYGIIKHLQSFSSTGNRIQKSKNIFILDFQKREYYRRIQYQSLWGFLIFDTMYCS